MNIIQVNRKRAEDPHQIIKEEAETIRYFVEQLDELFPDAIPEGTPAWSVMHAIHAASTRITEANERTRNVSQKALG
ncbi:hypothetical protein ACWS7L_07630 [Exiguobacterium artemiae]